MRLLMVGAGGIGGYFGACFAAAGHDVTFLARGATLAALRERGLTVESTVAPAHLAVKATDRVEDAGQPDAIVLCTKLADLDSAAGTGGADRGAALSSSPRRTASRRRTSSGGTSIARGLRPGWRRSAWPSSRPA